MHFYAPEKQAMSEITRLKNTNCKNENLKFLSNYQWHFLQFFFPFQSKLYQHSKFDFLDRCRFAKKRRSYVTIEPFFIKKSEFYFTHIDSFLNILLFTTAKSPNIWCKLTYQNVRGNTEKLVIKRLLTLGSLSKQAKCHWVLGKDTLCLFSFGASNLVTVVAQPDERHVNKTKKKVLCVGVVRQMQNAWFIWTNKLKRSLS